MVKRFLKRLGVLLLIGGMASAATVWAQTRPEPLDRCNVVRLGDAQDRYEFGFFDETIALLQPCLSKSFATEKQRAFLERLGVTIPPGCSKEKASELIDEAQAK